MCLQKNSQHPLLSKANPKAAFNLIDEPTNLRRVPADHQAGDVRANQKRRDGVLVPLVKDDPATVNDQTVFYEQVHLISIRQLDISDGRAALGTCSHGRFFRAASRCDKTLDGRQRQRHLLESVVLRGV
jgi:hypothetical protein